MSKIRPKNDFFCYVPFLGLIFWVTFCLNRNILTFDSNSYKKTNLSGVKNNCNSKSPTLSRCSQKKDFQNTENPIL